MTTTDPTDWPPSFRAALEQPSLARRGWQANLAPQLIGLFLWIAYFDQIPAETLGRSGLLWPVAGAAIGGILGYLCLYRSPALWGQRTGRPIAVLAARTFGVRGASWLPGLPFALVQVVWLAISTGYGTTLCLTGLELLGLLDPGFHRPVRVAGLDLPGHLFLIASLAWTLACSLTGRYLIRVISALMNVYPILPALLLGLTAAVALKGLPDYQAEVSRIGSDGGEGGVVVALVVVQFVFAFFSAASLLAADWGAVCRRESDVKLGGWVGVTFASWVVATLALLSVAGAFTRYGLRVPVGPGSFSALTFSHAVRTLIGGKAGGMVLIGFGLTALAPACYSAHLLGEGLHTLQPRVSRTYWGVTGALIAWVLIVTGRVQHLLPVYSLIGAVFAPISGAIAADYVRSRGRWPAARRGWNGPGWLSWAVGLVVGLTPLVGSLLGNPRLAAIQPAAVFAFVFSFLTYLALALLGGESPDEPIPPLVEN